MFITKYKNKHGALRLDSFVVDGVLRVPRLEWQEIKGQFDQLEIRREIAAVHDRLDLEPPFYHIEGGVLAAQRSFEALLALNTKTIPRFASPSEQIVSRHKYEFSLSKWYLRSLRVGNTASDFFHRRNRMHAGHIRFPSPIEIWNDKSHRVRCLKPCFTLNWDAITPSLIESGIALRAYIASQFKPCIARTLYEIFGARDVLDPSAGWGDRFCGFSAARNTRSYVGVDPNLNLHPGYWEQGRMYNTGKAYDFIPEPFEDADLGGRMFDFVFTSPPYFNTEKYSEHEGQSWKRYGSLAGWLESFLLPSIRKAWKHLKPGGFMAINIADLGTAYDDTSVCDVMNRFLQLKCLNSWYVGCLGMQMSGRPGTGGVHESGKIFIEPIWIWRKGVPGLSNPADYWDISVFMERFYGRQI